jgi:hypothetical protein
VAAGALLYVVSPVRAVGSELSARLGGSDAAVAAGAGRSQETETPAVSLTESPLVTRMGKDEFRLAFGIDSVGCARNGCYGEIRYRVSWKAEDGTTRSDIRQVSYTVLPDDARSITFDRQYFDTAEGAHLTDVVAVTVARITCHRGTESGKGYRSVAQDEVVPVPQQQ